MKMTNTEFERVLRNAIDGSNADIEKIFKLYEPMIYKYSCVSGKFNEDICQQLLLHIALNIHKFPI